MSEEKAQLIAQLEQLVAELKRGDRGIMPYQPHSFEAYDEELNRDGCYYIPYEIYVAVVSTEKGKRLAQ
jgi:hypothetical protein